MWMLVFTTFSLSVTKFWLLPHSGIGESRENDGWEYYRLTHLEQKKGPLCSWIEKANKSLILSLLTGKKRVRVVLPDISRDSLSFAKKRKMIMGLLT